MRVLITGGGGFIGRNMARLLPQFGQTVFAPTHKELDILDYDALKLFVEDNEIDTVVHTATSGGTKDITYQDFENNLKMCHNLITVFQSMKDARSSRLINIGSGAAFDRNRSISRVRAGDFFDAWPTDLYGLSKNISARRFGAEGKFGCVATLNLFGCFGPDEDPSRFVRRTIERLKSKLSIEIANSESDCRIMDFFYIDDVATTLNEYIQGRLNANHINLVYPEKLDLREISNIIYDAMPLTSKPFYPCYTYTPGPYKGEYTGDAFSLEFSGPSLIGLREGIRKTVQALL